MSMHDLRTIIVVSLMLCAGTAFAVSPDGRSLSCWTSRNSANGYFKVTDKSETVVSLDLLISTVIVNCIMDSPAGGEFECRKNIYCDDGKDYPPFISCNTFFWSEGETSGEIKFGGRYGLQMIVDQTKASCTGLSHNDEKHIHECKCNLSCMPFFNQIDPYVGNGNIYEIY